MNNNIFIKQNKDKHNPDIDIKMKEVDDTRNNTNFELTNVIYNPITGVVPQKINDMKDLMLQRDSGINKTEIQNMLRIKEAERLNQDTEYKPIKTKIISNEKMQSENRSNYIETYEDMKKGGVKQKQPDKNYNNILDGLKDLGILK
jgi:hypothetical protein